MATVFLGLIGLKCLVYLDGIIVFEKNLEDHNKQIDAFKRLKVNNLKIELSKCNLLNKECLYLGHVITEHRIKPDKSKIKAVLEYPRPKNLKSIKSFLGLSKYCRKFIKLYSLIAKSLTKLLQQDVKFN